MGASRREHMVDFLFPMALLFLFALSALTVVLLATNLYRSTVERSARNDTARIALSYVSEKLHRGDADGDARLGSLDGCDALVLGQSVDDVRYHTYIYVYDGALRELFIKEGIEPAAASGRAILPMQSFTLTQTEEGVFCFTFVDEHGSAAQGAAALRSESGVSP